MNTWDEVAASKPAYAVLAPQSVAYWFSMALVAENNRRSDLRDHCLHVVEEITAKRSVQSE